ncbi:hypothetical protein LTS18_008301 [Coniosporium uncinatum]|uniref:Uncharacterized protein n=1 Tax=Coniosporium uncinatum TaxID=93489 RepID=A0ACC3DC51_9PEZI|nr:hypothetical protein LTS18_008301 [Coniosporium uncinatum]
MITNGETHGAKLDFRTFRNVINGRLTKTVETRHGINPSTLESNPEVPVSTREDVDEAVRYARQASQSWAEVPLAERQQAVIRFAAALKVQEKEFAAMLTKEQGKPLFLAIDELAKASHWLDAQARLPYPEEIVEETEERIVVTRYTPLGVALAIVPWNYPVLLACGKIAPALVSGNTLILKPSPFTPYCGLKLAELAQQFFPPGVLQALSGDDNLGPWLSAHDGIDKISFTGSTATGKVVMQSCAKTLKRVTLELGGKDPAIVCSDVDVKETAPKIAQLAFLNSGQICIAIKRIYVHSSIYEDFLAAFVEAIKALVVGDGYKENVSLGPIQNCMQFEKLQALLEDIDQQHLNVATGGRKFVQGAEIGKGYFLKPTVVDNPPDESRIVREEPFGPIVPLLRWDSEDEVVARANNTSMGLGASVWSKNVSQAGRLARKLQAGNVWINTHLDTRPDAAFGGHKQSGIGAEWGIEGLKSYCNTQTLFLSKL